MPTMATTTVHTPVKITRGPVCLVGSRVCATFLAGLLTCVDLWNVVQGKVGPIAFRSVTPLARLPPPPHPPSHPLHTFSLPFTVIFKCLNRHTMFQKESLFTVIITILSFQV